MIIVYQEKGRYESPKNMVIDHIKQTIRSNIWADAHTDTLYQYGYDIEKYPLPTIVNIIQC